MCGLIVTSSSILTSQSHQHPPHQPYRSIQHPSKSVLSFSLLLKHAHMWIAPFQPMAEAPLCREHRLILLLSACSPCCVKQFHMHGLVINNKMLILVDMLTVMGHASQHLQLEMAPGSLDQEFWQKQNKTHAMYLHATSSTVQGKQPHSRSKHTVKSQKHCDHVMLCFTIHPTIRRWLLFKQLLLTSEFEHKSLTSTRHLSIVTDSAVCVVLFCF